LRAIALVLPLTVLAQLLAAAVGGLERVSGDVARRVVEQAGRVLFLPLAIVLGFGLVGAVVGMAIAAVCAIVVVSLVLLRHLPRGGHLAPPPTRQVFAFAWPQGVASLAPQFWQIYRLAILADLVGPRAVAVFGAALTISQVPWLFYFAFAYRFSPTITRLWEDRRQAELRSLLQSVTRWIAMLAVPLLGLLIAVPGSYLGLFGSKYQAGGAVLALLAVGVTVDTLSGPVEAVLIMTGQVRLELAANIVTAAGMAPVAYFLVRADGAEGAAIASICYSALLNALKGSFVYRRVGVQPFSRALARPCAAAAIAGACLFAVARLTHSSTVGTIAISIGALALYVVLLVRVIGIPPADRRSLVLAARPQE
jgi:O-antigen/teichoic acid export membrane protein